MSIIQTIRDKAAWIIIGAIALALIAFIVQDAFSGRSGGLFSGQSTTIGKINGTKVDYMDFEKRLATAEKNYSNNGQAVDENFRQQIRESLWNEYVENAVLDKELNKLGFVISNKEKADVLYGPNPPQQLRQQFTNAEGVYDAQAAYQAINSLKKKSPEYNNFWGEYVPALEKQRIREKFIAMISKSYYVPKWLIEKRNANNSQLASISYVNIPYGTIADSTVKVSDDDVRKYVDAHKEGFKQEEVRGVEYVLFNAAPSAADSAEVKQRVEKLKDSFATTNDIKAFFLRENSQANYYESNISLKEIKIPNIDSIVKTPVGGVYGPYLDGNSYTLARMVSVKQWPDTVKVRHILIATHQQNQQTGEFQPVRYDSTAKRIADSVELAIKSGANFDSLCAKYSDDGNKNEGGIYDKVTANGRWAAAFNDFIFGKPVGSKGVEKTEFGYHYIEVLSQKGSSPAYNIAYFSQPVYPSELTTNTAHQQATTFASESRTRQAFEDNVKKKNLNKFNAYDIRPMDNSIPGVGNSRELVTWMYREAKLGDVAPQPFFVGDKYIVPVLVNSYEKGTMPVERARPLVEYKIRNEKKAQQIAQKVGTPATLDAVTKAVNQPVQQMDSVRFSASYIPNLGNELKLIGASFNKNYQAKVSDPIFGELGVYYIKVNNITALPNAGSLDVKLQQQMAAQQVQRAGYLIIENLKKAADITDNRYKFY